MSEKDLMLSLTFTALTIMVIFIAGPTIYRDWRNSKKTDLIDKISVICEIRGLFSVIRKIRG